MAGQVTLQNRTWFLPQVAGDSCRVVKYFTRIRNRSAQKLEKVWPFKRGALASKINFSLN